MMSRGRFRWSALNGSSARHRLLSSLLLLVVSSWIPVCGLPLPVITSWVMDSKTIRNKMQAALMRSGYVMESRIVSRLTDSGYFVQPNQRIADPKTGKTREIDFIAEAWDINRADIIAAKKMSVLTRFVCEAKNNPNPVVVLTKVPYTPHLLLEECLREARTGNFRHATSSFLDLFLGEETNAYSQYCSFKVNKSKAGEEWVAWHPDDFYDDLEKIIAYCDQEVVTLSSLDDGYDRLHLYLPVVVLGGDLYVCQSRPRSIRLKKVQIARYIHFGFNGDSQTLACVVFVTETSMEKFFRQVEAYGHQIAKEAIANAMTQQEGC